MKKFVLSLKPGKNAEETANRVMQELIRLTEQLNGAGIPITLGPNQELPTDINIGQSVIDWRSGASVLRVWNGSTLI